jgi:hypothetical protein
MRPVQCVVSPGGRAKRQINHPLDGLRRQRRLAGLARLVAKQTVDTLLHEALLPAPDHWLRLARLPHHLKGAVAIGRGKDDPSPPDMLLWGTTIRNDRLKPMAILGRDVYNNPCSHAASLNCFARLGNHLNASID